MQKKITETTAQNSLGQAPGKKLLKVPSGEFAGRMAALIQTAAGTIKLYNADAPYTSWSAPITVATDAIDDAFAATIDANGNIHIVYSETSTEFLVTKKLTFSGGTWSAGSKITIYNGNPSHFSTLAIEPGGRIWVSYTRINSSLYYIYVKSSDDAGATWGSGTSDPGTTLSSGYTSAFSKLAIGPNELYAVYTGAGTDLYFTKRAISGGSWSSSVIISSTGTFDHHFDIAVNAEGLLGVVFDNDQLRFREFDGINWSAVASLDSSGGTFPQVDYFGNVPVVIYLHQFASGQIELRQTNKQTGVFSAPVVLDTRAKQFDKVTIYDSVSNSYADLTSQSTSAITADILHPSTSALVKAVGDSIFLGMAKKFRYIRFLLSTAGVGGSVNYSYWDGNVWKAFVPQGGNFNLNSTDKQLLLWTDFESQPSDWQQNPVDGSVNFWVRIKADTLYSTAPVGSQITALSDITGITVRR
ncbi:MAG TPA: hypothetical protein VHP63_07170 [candidate division Zixibacteria bacterium]|nr:hypothetical protein [candidate division Zixibacteria bacterium]